MSKFVRLLPLLFLLFPAISRAQQDPMFTKYQFNSLAFNPAYAGSLEHLAVFAVHRQQWLGLEGAPSTSVLSAHMPLRKERIGLGAHLAYDKIGPTGVVNLGLAYAYRVSLGNSWKLAGGLQAEIMHWRSNWSELTLEQIDDVAFQENISRWLPNLGAGIYLSSDYFYAGLGCPRLLELDLREPTTGTSMNARVYRHYYTTVGAAIPLDRREEIVFRPSVLLKSTDWGSSWRKEPAYQNIGSPTEIDIDASCFFLQRFWVGASYRTALQRARSSDDSVDFYASLYLPNGLRVGASYDLLISPLQRVSNGSFEVMLGYEFNFKTNRITSPRYF